MQHATGFISRSPKWMEEHTVHQYLCLAGKRTDHQSKDVYFLELRTFTFSGSQTSQQPTLASHYHHDIPRLSITATNLTAARPLYVCLTWAHLTSVHLRIFQLYSCIILHLHIRHLPILHLDPSHLRTLHLRFLHLRIFYLTSYTILHHVFLICASCIFTSCIYLKSSVLTSVYILSLLSSFFFFSLSLSLSLSLPLSLSLSLSRLSLFSLFSFILTCSFLIARA